MSPIGHNYLAGIDLCCVFIIDVYRGGFRRNGLMVSGRNIDFLIINVAR